VQLFFHRHHSLGISRIVDAPGAHAMERTLHPPAATLSNFPRTGPLRMPPATSYLKHRDRKDSLPFLERRQEGRDGALVFS
jgi:hypothetical protein